MKTNGEESGLAFLPEPNMRTSSLAITQPQPLPEPESEPESEQVLEKEEEMKPITATTAVQSVPKAKDKVNKTALGKFRPSVLTTRKRGAIAISSTATETQAASKQSSNSHKRARKGIGTNETPGALSTDCHKDDTVLSSFFDEIAETTKD